MTIRKDNWSGSNSTHGSKKPAEEKMPLSFFFNALLILKSKWFSAFSGSCFYTASKEVGCLHKPPFHSRRLESLRCMYMNNATESGPLRAYHASTTEQVNPIPVFQRSAKNPLRAAWPQTRCMQQQQQHQLQPMESTRKSSSECTSSELELWCCTIWGFRQHDILYASNSPVRSLLVSKGSKLPLLHNTAACPEMTPETDEDN